MKHSNFLVYAIGFVIIQQLCVCTLQYGHSNNFDFKGADDSAQDIISDMDPYYKPWTCGIWGNYEIPSEIESMLFSIQASIGAMMIGYFIGRYTNKKQ